MKILISVLFAGLLLCQVAYADLFDSVVDYIKSRPVKAGISYDFDGKEALSTIATTLTKVSKVDVDLGISGAGLDLFNDNDVIVSSGLGYTFKDKITLSISGGLKRFESFHNGETGEGKVLASLLYKF